MSEREKEKLIKLIEYWIEHSKEHGSEFMEWAGQSGRFAKETVQQNLEKAAQQMDTANEFLLKALEELKEK